MMHTISSPLRWNADVEWTIDARTGQQPRVSFLRGGNPLLVLDVARPVVEFLQAKRDPQGGERIPNLPPAFAPLLQLLQERRIVVPDSSIPATVRMFSDATTLLHACTVASVRPRTIEFLVGDEASLQRHHDAFLASRDDQVLVGTVCLSRDRVDVGPVRWRHEAAGLTRRALYAQAFPAWPQRWQHVVGALEEMLMDACQGPAWFSLTERGMRLGWSWQEATSPYQVETFPVTVPRQCIPLHYARARVENSLLSGGTAEHGADAAFAAQGEAWERFCMGRCDLATAAVQGTPTYMDWTGAGVEYLRQLTQPLPVGPMQCAGWVPEAQGAAGMGAPIAVPTHWVYFQNGTAAITNTNGAAYGSTLADAIASGRQELLERHALMRAYMQGVPGRCIPADALDASVRALVALAPRHQARFYHLATLNGLHVVACVLGADTPPFMSLGAAARPSLAAAARKAFCEVASMDMDWARDVERMGPQRFLDKSRSLREAPAAGIGLMEGAMVWAGMREAPHRLHDIFHGDRVPTDTLDESKFVVVDIGSRVVADAHIVKVLHPDALPLPSFHGHALHLADMLGVKLTLPLPLA